MKTVQLIIIPIILFFAILGVIVFGFANNAEPKSEPQDQSDICPEEIDFIYESQRRIISCGANPPQTKFSILKLEGVNQCKINQDLHYYMDAGDKASITYSYEITENKQNPNQIFDLDKAPHFLCKIENVGYKACVPDGIHVNYELDAKYITVNNPETITAHIQIDDDVPTQHLLLHLTPNICTNPELLFSVLNEN